MGGSLAGLGRHLGDDARALDAAAIAGRKVAASQHLAATVRTSSAAEVTASPCTQTDRPAATAHVRRYLAGGEPI